MANQAAVARIRILLIVVVTIAGLAVLMWVRGRRSGVDPAPVNLNGSGPITGQSSESSAQIPTPTVPPADSTVPPPSPAQTPDSSSVDSAPATGSNQSFNTGSFVGTLKLVIPVTGVRPDQLLDTFSDARSDGRVHDAIDIPAPAGTPVVAAADGQIIKLFQSERGGITIYQFSADKKLIFYYAHLQRYAEGSLAGKFVKQGEVIAFVGDTGNAGTGNFHLHFSIAVVDDPKRYWEGTNINPYPLLH